MEEIKYYVLWQSFPFNGGQMIDATSDRGDPERRKSLIRAGYHEVTEQDAEGIQRNIRRRVDLAAVL
jgi:hypothetical protein